MGMIRYAGKDEDYLPDRLIAREILEDGDRALTLIRDEIIEDCNQYVPVQGSEKHNGGGGSMQNSASYIQIRKQKMENWWCDGIRRMPNISMEDL